MKKEPFDPGDYEVADLRRKLRGRKFKEGENVAYTDKGGVKLLATVKSGQIIDWRVVNNQGEEIQSMHIRKLGKGTAKRPKIPHCYVCGVIDDVLVCLRVNCW